MRRPWQPGLTLVTVTVFLPGGGRFDLDWLTRDGPAGSRVARAREATARATMKGGDRRASP